MCGQVQCFVWRWGFCALPSMCTKAEVGAEGYGMTHYWQTQNDSFVADGESRCVSTALAMARDIT